MAVLKQKMIVVDVTSRDIPRHTLPVSISISTSSSRSTELAVPVIQFSSFVPCAEIASNRRNSGRKGDAAGGYQKKRITESFGTFVPHSPAPSQNSLQDMPVTAASSNGWGRQGGAADNSPPDIDKGKFSDIVAGQARDVSRISFEGTPYDAALDTAAGKSRNSYEGAEVLDKDRERTKIAADSNFLDPENQWQNVFPSYMQSKGDESDDLNLSSSHFAQANGAVVNGVVAKKAAAAATASAKALESHVTTAPPLSAPPCSAAKPPTEGGKNLSDLISHDPIWAAIRAEARLEAEREPLLSSFLYASILAHPCFERSLGFILANRLKNATLLATQLMDVFDDVFGCDLHVQQAIRLDVQALKDRDPSCRSYSSAVLYLKGYHALQAYRIAHVLWNRGQQVFALALQSRISEVFAVDIHPAARIGKSILLDHGTGVVIGETAVIGDRVSLMQGVTLGGTGKDSGDRHPKIKEGVLIGVGATILGNIVVGKGAMIAAGSLVLKDVPPHGMVAGTPAKLIGILEEPTPALTMQHDVTRDFCADLEAAVRRQLAGEHELYGGAGI